MFSRLFGFIFILCILYGILIFLAPSFTDKYGNTEINNKIRNFKDKTQQLSSGGSTPTSIFEQIKGTTTTYIDESKNTIQTIETTVQTKVDQAKDVSRAIENVYSGVVDATQKIQILTGTGIK